MNKIKKKQRPEEKIQDAIIEKLLLLGWYVKSTHGSIYQAGFPDLYVGHKKYGARWCEVKNPDAYCFTPAQIENFHLMSAAGIGVWIATSVDQVPDLFFKPPNWYLFLPVLK